MSKENMHASTYYRKPLEKLSPYHPILIARRLPTLDIKAAVKQGHDRGHGYSDSSPVVIVVIIVVGFGIWNRLSTNIRWDNHRSTSTSW